MSTLWQQIANRHDEWDEQRAGAATVSPEVDRAFLLSLCSAQAIELEKALGDLREAEASLRIAHDALGEEVRDRTEAQASLRSNEAEGAERQNRRWASYVRAIAEALNDHSITAETNIHRALDLVQRALDEAPVQEYRP